MINNGMFFVAAVLFFTTIYLLINFPLWGYGPIAFALLIFLFIKDAMDQESR